MVEVVVVVVMVFVTERMSACLYSYKEQWRQKLRQQERLGLR